MTEIIDASFDCGDKAALLHGAGVRTIIRYYSRDTIRPTKRLTLAEARQFAAAGLRIGIVHEGRRGDRPDNYDHDCGFADGQYAQHYGLEVIGQPRGTAIYFGIDFDATAAQIRDRILPYFQGLADGMSALGGPAYEVGVYGSGRTCAAVLDAGLATKAWLAQSTGWAGYTQFLASNRWTMSQAMPATIAGVPCDPDTTGIDKEIGDFLLTEPVADTPAVLPAPLYVIARSGLRVREGPGTDFEAHPHAMPFGARVFALKKTAGWTLVDLQGDGKADGFVSSEFLSTTPPGHILSAPAIKPVPLSRTADATRVAELLRQGTSAEGLKQARTTAAASLPGYPTNGCAAHLSALLQQAGISVPMTWGAGKLAALIAQRGWTRIAVHQQMPGDVGVCFDNNPNPPGADHIYLVVQALGDDEMMIADNQRTTDAPHSRFASGHGKTPTEYFLRAM
jgi:hypothetical protein